MSHAENSFLCSCDVSLVPLLHDISRTVWSVYSRRCIYFFCNRFSPHYELFETQTQFIVVTKELGVCWDLIQKDLCHLQWALKQRGGERRDKNKDTGSDSQRKQKTEVRRKDKPHSGWKTTSWKNAQCCHGLWHTDDIRSEKEAWFASCVVNATTEPAHIHHLSPIYPVRALLTYIHHKTTVRLSSAWISANFS